MDEELKPIAKQEEKENDNFNFELNTIESPKEEVEVSKFIEGFPNWDLLPPNQVVRRVNRK